MPFDDYMKRESEDVNFDGTTKTAPAATCDISRQICKIANSKIQNLNWNSIDQMFCQRTIKINKKKKKIRIQYQSSFCCQTNKNSLEKQRYISFQPKGILYLTPQYYVFLSV